jgi:hypothetical protein
MSDGPFPRPPRAYPSHASDGSDRHASSSDPLLELARLIGQSDPFGPPPARGGDSPRAPDLPTRGPMARPPSRELSPGFDRYEADRRYEADSEREQPQPRPHPFPALQTFPSRSLPPEPEDRGDDRYSEPTRDDPPPAARERFEFPSLGGSERHGGSERFGGSDHDRAPQGHSAYADETYPTVPDQHYPAEPEPAYVEGDHYPHPASTRPEALHRDDAYPQEGEQDGEYEGQNADAEGHRYDEYEYADDGVYEDDELGGKRRNWIKFALALLGVVVFGSAAAFGYRAIFRGGTDGPPPLIRADTSPTKIVPASSTADAGSKPINDRLGNGSGERMVSREEQPVDLKDPARNPNSGVVAPLSGGAAVAPYPPATATGAAPPAAAATTEPKRVRTVTIHADPAAPAAPAAAALAAPAAPAPARAAVPRPAAQAPQPAAPSQSAAPLALTPQSPSSVAAVETARPPAPARAAPRAAESGGWMVQLSAQKTEAEAQSAFRAAQTKYSVLGGYQPLIRKKDRGDRGVFYGAQVGPLSREEANQLCDSLKSAGSDCFVLKN